MDRNVKKRLQRAGLDVAFLAGCAVCAFGLWLAWRPLGFIVGGIAIAAVAFFAGYQRLGNEGQ
jgi:hypothetical protein